MESADDDMSIRTLAVVRQKAGACYAMAGDLGRAEEQWAVVSQARATVPLPFFLFFWFFLIFSVFLSPLWPSQMGLDHSECLSPSEQGTVMAQRATAQLQLGEVWSA